MCCCFSQCKNMCVLYKMAFHFLIFNLERHQRELFSPGQLQWFLPPMEVSKLQHPTKSSLWRSDDGLIPEKNKAEVYLGSMESKHTTWFTRKKRAKNKQFCLHFDRFWHWKPCYYYIYWTLFSAIAYVIFILTQRLVPVCNHYEFLLQNIYFNYWRHIWSYHWHIVK